MFKRFAQTVQITLLCSLCQFSSKLIKSSAQTLDLKTFASQRAGNSECFQHTTSEEMPARKPKSETFHFLALGPQAGEELIRAAAVAAVTPNGRERRGHEGSHASAALEREGAFVPWEALKGRRTSGLKSKANTTTGLFRTTKSNKRPKTLLSDNRKRKYEARGNYTPSSEEINGSLGAILTDPGHWVQQQITREGAAVCLAPRASDVSIRGTRG